MASSASKNARFTLPYGEKMALRETLRELLTEYTKTNGNRVLSIAIRFDKAEKKTSVKSTAIDGLLAPEKCAVTVRAELFPLKPLRSVNEKNADDKLPQTKKDDRNSPGSLLHRSFSTTTSTYVSFPLYLPGEEPFEFCGSASDSTWPTIILFGEQTPPKPPRRFIDRDVDVYSMHASRPCELPWGEKYAVEMVEKTKAVTQGESVQIAAVDNGSGVDGDDARVVALQVGFPMEK